MTNNNFLGNTQSTIPNLPLERFFSYGDLVELTGLSLSTLKRMVQRNELPKPFAISKRAVRFKLSDLTKYPLFFKGE